MRRWNGWGDQNTHYHLPESAGAYLAQTVGEPLADATAVQDANFDAVVATVPPSRLPEHPLIDPEPAARLWHARGQSLPDWVALRSGQIGVFPDGVAFPADEAQVRELISYAKHNQVKIIPYGGGTSVVGHINPQPGPWPVLTIDLGRMNHLLDLDTHSHLARFQAGVCGPDLEQQLNTRGYTLGHFPQSFELSTLGGWIAARSSGQQSYHYGRIENLFAGGYIETPLGPLDLPNLPASAAGPDLRQFVLGSEGRLGVITQATVRVRPLPESEAFYGVFFPTWQQGCEAVRQIIHQGTGVSMARLSDADETETTLRLSGKDQFVEFARRGLSTIGYGPERCLLIFGATGNTATVRFAVRQTRAAVRRCGGLFTGQMAGKLWRKSRFLSPYLRNVLWERGYAIDTLETAVPWSQVLTTAEAIKAAIHRAHEEAGEKVLVIAHLSHVYRDGASIYITYLYRRSRDPEQTLDHWQRMKSAASQAIVAHGGTISHQHGVGVDHAPYLHREKDSLGMQVLQDMIHSLDPNGMMNPGKLLN